MNKNEMLKTIKTEINIFAEIYCRECDTCTDKDCPMQQLLQGKINRFGVSITHEPEPTYELYNDEKLY